MTVFRIQKKENYVVLDKGFLNDTSLSWQAKGLLAYMLSLPNDWRFNLTDLTNRSKSGRDATSTVIKELSKAGYIHKQQVRAERGKFGNTELLVYETPHIAPSTEKPLTVNPTTVEPQTGEPSTENPTLVINNSLNNNLLINNNDDDNKAPAYAVRNPEPKTPNAFQFHEQNGFGVISHHVAQKIDAWINDLSEELVIHAMERAVENNVYTWKYVEAILKDWDKKRLKSISDIQADDKRRETAKNSRTQSFNKRVREEQVPEWFHNRNESTTASVAEPLAQDELQNFEAQRQKVLERLGKNTKD